MACDLCRTFPERTVRQLNQDLESGELSLSEVADKYYVSVPLVEDHRRLCVTPMPTTGHEILIELLKEVRRAADDRKGQYELDPDANNLAMTHYVNLIREARELVVAMNRIKPSDELTQDIIAMILGPLIKQTVSITADEAKRLRTDLSELVPTAKYRNMDQAVKDMLDRFAARLNRELAESADRLRKLLAAGGKSRSQKSDDLSDPSLVSPTEVH